MRVHRSPTTVGVDAGSWLPYGNPADLPGDQRCEDARSLTFDSEPLAEELDILGKPVVRLRLAADRATAFVAVRLCDVHPDGTSALITRGILNLCRREGHDTTTPLEPGRAVDVVVPLKAIGQTVPAGHTLRLAVSTSYWPWIWPSPSPVGLTITCDQGSSLELPIRPADAGVDAHEPFDEPELSEPLAFEWLAPRTPALDDRPRRHQRVFTPSRCPARSGGSDASRTASRSAIATPSASPSSRATLSRQPSSASAR